MAPENPAPQDPAPIIDRRRWPAGTLPRNVQAWTLLGLAALMTAVMWLSTPGAPSTPKAPVGPPWATTDASQRQIEQFQRQVEEEMRKLAAERAQLEMAKRAQAAASAAPTSTSMGPLDAPTPAAPTSGATDGMEHERRQREYRSLFTPSVVWTAAPTPAASTETPAASSSPSSAATAPPANPAGRYLLRQGTLLDAVLLNRLDGQFTGPVHALVTVPAYSEDRQHVLIPAGTRLLGEAKAVEHRGQTRLAVAFQRLILPNDEAIDLEAVKGLNQTGDAGLHDQVDHHYWQVFGAALAVGALGGLSQSVGYGGEPSAVDAYARGMATTFGHSATHILDRFLNVLPTVTIREGHRLKVYLSRDLSLASAERVHPIPSTEVP